MRAVQITRFGGPEVLDVVDLPDPVPGDGQHLYEVSAAGVNCADTHQQRRATDLTEPARRPTSVPPVDDGRGSGMPAVCAHGNGDRARRQFCERIGLAGLLALRTL
jgi:hypothetical protein